MLPSQEALRRMGIDEIGLDEMDRSLLRAIIEMYNGGPVGLETIAAALGEESVLWKTVRTLSDAAGIFDAHPRGRCVTRHAYEHLGMKAPGAPEQKWPADAGRLLSVSICFFMNRFVHIYPIG